MIKHINHQNFQTTPFVAAKNWHLFNVESDDLVILELTGSEDTVALEFIDYSSGTPVENAECSIALEQQGQDRIVYQEGITGSGTFLPDNEPTNKDGTFKRLVHSQVKSTFYNKFNNPTKIFGVEYIDFPLSRTFRDLSDFARIFTIPRNIFGERVIENTVHLADNSLDDNVEIVDDGYQNLIAKFNLFSKVQEVRTVIRSFRSSSNIIISDYVPVTGSNVSTITQCLIGFLSGTLGNAAINVSGEDTASSAIGFLSGTLGNSPVIASGSENGIVSSSIGFLFGTLDNVPITEDISPNIAFYTGSLLLGVITSSASDSGSVNVAFYTGSLLDQVVSSSRLEDSGSVSMTFYTGSLFDLVITSSRLEDSGSVSMTFYTGSLFTQAVTSSRVRTFETSSTNIGFLNGTLT